MSRATVPNPFTAGPSVLQFMGTELQRKSGVKVPVSVVVADVVGLYFSAHWCPPCRMFTPRLTSIYNEARYAGKSLEIIFVSGDKDERQFNEYFAQMGDWLAVPFECSSRKSLGQHLGVNSIPALILLNGKTGQIMSMQGRNDVMMSSFIISLPPDIDAEALTPLKKPRTVDSLMDAISELEPEAMQQGLKVLRTAFTNILAEPNNMKYRSLKKLNSSVSTKLAAPQLLAILKAGGFRERSDAYVCWRPQVNVMKEALTTIDALLESYTGQ